MTCIPDKPVYRLLDANVGWSPLTTSGLTGLRSPNGLRLEPTGNVPCTWMSRFVPPRLAWDCEVCEFLLVTPAPSRVLRLGRCDCCWRALWPSGCQPIELGELTAIASHDDRFAIADRTYGVVHHFAKRGGRHLGDTPIQGALALAYDADGTLIVVCEPAAAGQPVSIVCIDRQLRSVRRHPLAPGIGGPLIAARVHDHALWIIFEPRIGVLRAWRVDPFSGASEPVEWSVVQRMLPTVPVTAANDTGFCISRARRGRLPLALCWTWQGRCVDEHEIVEANPACASIYAQRGRLQTEPLDSMIPDCRWHRVILDAQIPHGATLLTACATSEVPNPHPATNPLDWRPANGESATDFLVPSNPGRYLHLRFALGGDGTVTPRLRRVRIEFPRVTSLEYLPPVYRESSRAENFTERFLALFDSVLAEFDASIERFPALFDVQHAADEITPWLGTWLDVADDPRWSPQVRRRVLRALPSLYSRRGTRFGLKAALRLVLDLPSEIQELGPERAFAGLGQHSRLGTVRVFGRAVSRLRLGVSPLGVAPIRSHGNPDRDPLSANAYRFRVLLPADAARISRFRLDDLVASQKPAHTVESLRMPLGAFMVGSASTVGIDTAFRPQPQPVLGASGKGNIRLRRRSILAGGASGKHALVAGTRIGVGLNTLLE